MITAMEAILTRRSVRSFTAQSIPDAILQELANAAMHAPSGAGKKTWKFFVISNTELIKELAAAIGRELSMPAYDMYGPTALIIPTNVRSSPFGREDNACALENIFLAAHAYGIGSVWLNQFQGICDTPEIRGLLRKIGVPDDHVVYGAAALGYPDGSVGKFTEKGEVVFVR